jgi:ABC-type uncharacterized transport system substrate-binding protein
MTNKISLLLILLLTLCLTEHSWAYEAAVLKSADIQPYNEALEGFRSSCDCSVKTLVANGMEKSTILEEIYRLHPDMVLAIGMGALAQVRTIRDLPVVYVMAPGPLSPAPESRNISGVSMNISPSKYLDAVTKLFPGARRIGLVYDPKSSEAYVEEAMRSAAARGIELVVKKTGTAVSVPSLMDSLKDKIDIFWMLPEAYLLNSATIDYMLLFSFENKVPIFTFSKKYVEMGAAAALTVDSSDMGAQAGAIAKKLQGATAAGQIRVDANVSGLVINRKVLEKLGTRFNEKIKVAKDVD